MVFPIDIDKSIEEFDALKIASRKNNDQNGQNNFNFDDYKDE